MVTSILRPLFRQRSGRIVLGALLLSYAGCRNEQTDEKREADRLLAETRTAMTDGRSEEARRLLMTVYSLDRTLDRDQQMAEGAELLARNYWATAEFDSAFWYFERAFEHYRSVADKYSARRVKLSTAVLYRQIGDEENAFAIYSELLRIARAIGDAQGVTELSWEILPSYRVLDRREEELEVLTDLLNQAKSRNVLSMQARVYLEWGKSHFYRGEYSSSVENYLRAFTLAEQAGDSIIVVSALANLALSYENEGNREEAFQAFTDGLRRSDRTPGAENEREEMLIRVGNIYLINRDFDEADRFYRAALQSAIGRKNKLREGYLWLQLGHSGFMRKGGRDEGMKSYQIALDLFTAYTYDPGISFAEACMGIAHLKAGELPDALTHLTAAAGHSINGGYDLHTGNLPAECEDAFYTLNETTLQSAYLEVLLLLGKYDEAFIESELRRRERLSDVFGTFSLDTGQFESTAALWESQRFRSLKNGALRELARALSGSASDKFILSSLQENIEGYKRQADEATARLAGAGRDFETLVEVGSMSIQETQETLPDGSLLLSAIPTSRSVFIFAIAKSEWTVQLSAVEGSRLSRYIDEYNSLLRELTLQTSSPGGYEGAKSREVRNLSRSLYSALVRPVSSFLSRYPRIIVVPHHELVSYHSLRKRTSRGKSRYIIQDHQVSYLPAVGALRLAGSPGRLPVDIVGLGHPGSTGWDVEYELRDIRAFHKETRLHFEQDATFGTLQREQGSTLHLAAEFHFDPRWPGNSFVRLSDGQTPTTATQVQWGRILSLQKFPVVIISDVSDHMGIPRAKPLLFIQQGSESVILTQYSTHRKTKKFFGELFYTSTVGGMASDLAYTETLRGMVNSEEYGPPHVWATFFRWGK